MTRRRLHTSAPRRTGPRGDAAGQPRPARAGRPSPGGAPINRTPLARDLLGWLDVVILLAVAVVLGGAVLAGLGGW